MDLFFGTDYHSHLGTKNGGMCVLQEDGFNRSIHNIENSPFRSKFEEDLEEMSGKMGIGSISDGDPQPLTVRSRQGDYAITTVGRINNKEELVAELLKDRAGQFMSMSGGGINNTQHFGISENYLGRYIKKHTNETMQQYICLLYTSGCRQNADVLSRQ